MPQRLDAHRGGYRVDRFIVLMNGGYRALISGGGQARRVSPTGTPAAAWLGLTPKTLQRMRVTGDGPLYAKWGRLVATVTAEGFHGMIIAPSMHHTRMSVHGSGA